MEANLFMTVFSPTDHPHRRYNPLIGEYVLVSPHRMKRPWQGKQESRPADDRPSYDEKCYLCPTNTRNTGAVNPDYHDTFVFTNDFAAVLPDTPDADVPNDDIFRLEAVRGTARVICFSPRHDLTLPEMHVPDIRKVVDVWAQQTTELGETYQWVQVFENKGEIMGSSMPHPHGQIWAENVLPNQIAKEDHHQRAYYEKHGTSLLVDYAQQESERRERIVAENEDWLVVVPYWAIWPFETLLMPRRHVLRLPDLTDGERNSLANLLKTFLTQYDNLFEVSFPYSMGWHGAPFNDDSNQHWQLHAHFYPPLLRSATVRKFMVGYEMMAESQRDLTPEQAAQRLRDLPITHFKQRT
jgi:UDPglucose--hexose-1-phosphate uridylyltransferase